jgi:hypothetical protein
LREPENTMSKRLVFMLSLPFAVVVGSRVVRSDLDNAPGSMCVAAAGALTVNTAGQVENKGTVNATAICPTERKMINGALATNFSATVWVLESAQRREHLLYGGLAPAERRHQRERHPRMFVGIVGFLPGAVGPGNHGTGDVRGLVREVHRPLPESGKTSRILTYRSTQS